MEAVLLAGVDKTREGNLVKSKSIEKNFFKAQKNERRKIRKTVHQGNETECSKATVIKANYSSDDLLTLAGRESNQAQGSPVCTHMNAHIRPRPEC